MRRSLVVAVATGLAALAAAPSAGAATVEVDGDTIVYDVDIQNPFAQDLLIKKVGDRFVFTEQGPERDGLINAKKGCKRDGEKVRSCPAAGIADIFVETENFDDVVTADSSVTVPVRFSMGQGGDEATGGAGGDRFLGGALVGLGNDTFKGLAGNDTFFGGPNADVMEGGDGSDTLDLSERILRQTVALDNEANDGDASDLASIDTAALSGADNAKDIENVIGGSARDTLTGNDSANTLEGRNAQDTLEGRLGADRLRGGSGNDEILARTTTEGTADPDAEISCGSGQDTVTADPEDGPVIAADCEDIDCGNCEVPPPPTPANPAPPSPNPPIAAIDPPGGANDADEGPGPGGNGTPPDPDGAGPQPAPTEPLPPRIEVVTGGVVPLKTNGTVPIRVVCIYRADRCAGSLTLKTKKAITARVGRRNRTIPKNTTIGTANLAPLRWGNSAPVNVRLSALFRTLLPLQRKPNVLVQATLVARDPSLGGSAPESTARGDLTIAGKGKRRR